MWRDICLMNRDAILTHLQGYQEKLKDLEKMVAQLNAQELEATFSAAREARAVVTERRRTPPTEEQVSMRRRVRQLVNH